MKIEIRATYAATDGRMPEDVSVDIEHDAQGLTLTSVVTEILPLLDRLLTAPAARGSAEVTGAEDFVVTHPDTTETERPAVGYVAGCDLEAGNLLEIGPDGRTLHLASGPGAAHRVAGMNIKQGEPMKPVDESGMWVVA